MAMEPPAKKMKAVVRDAQHCKRLVLSLQSFNMQNNFTDLCFVCARGHKVYAHKLLLCTVSSLLKQIFLDIPDHLQMITIHLPDVEGRLLSLMFDFLYEGSVRINKHEYTDFQKVMDMLGIVLTTPNKETVPNTVTASQPPAQPQAQLPAQLQAQPPPSPQQIQPSQLVYLQTTPNSQGQVQYVLAAPASLGQSSMVGMNPVVSAQTSSQPLMMSPNSGQMMQTGPQVQQNNMMQIVQPSGGQVVQCASQMVVQGNQQTILANNQMQVGMQNQAMPVAQSNYQQPQQLQQPIQQRTQYAMATPSRQYSQPQGRTSTQTQRGRAKTVQLPVQTRLANSGVRGRRVGRGALQPMVQNRLGVGTNRLAQRRQ
uniref:BTB domain-containing protein n=1 Tax=Graphocephala atropunctata TaxID=36148 RepID=A0A1B6KP49_9HEMI